jgi:linoleate 10R-lipoxygenase
MIAVSSPKHLAVYPCYCHSKKGDQSWRRVPEIADQVLASSLHICELLVSLLPLYVTNPLYYNSTYLCFPFFTPNLTRQGIADTYTFTRPVPVSLPNILNTSLASRPSPGSHPLRGPICDEKPRQDADLPLVSVLIIADIVARSDAYTNIVDLHAIFTKRDSLLSLAKWYGELVTKKIEETSWK